MARRTHTAGRLNLLLHITSWLAAVTIAAGATAQDGPLVPSAFQLSEAARDAVNAAWLTDEERSWLRVFHGVWDERDLTSPLAQAFVALNAWEFDHPALTNPDVPPEMQAEAYLRQGEPETALRVLGGSDSFDALRIRAEVHDQMGETEAALVTLNEPLKQFLREAPDSAPDLTNGVRALAVRARLEGQPARDYQRMMSMLGRAHQQVDRLYWPAKLAEAELLLEKDNEREAGEALHETLSLNPRCAKAWYLLGRMALDRFDFASASVAAESLRRIRRDHPLAALLDARSRLVQDDPEGAMDHLTPVLEQTPQMREALALDAAAHALSYDRDAADAAIAHYEELSPGSAQVYYEVGKHLSFNRQYEWAADMLEEAVERQPAWPAPRIELGLMELQSGRDDRALAALRAVAEIDPFNKRAANSLFLLEELANYATVESEHFIVRYKPGIDEVMVDTMLEPLEKIHETVSSRFEWEPQRKTVIELMPDHQFFAVRITGMPFIHTIAACTGPVIAMETPRIGKPSEHLGLFDWPRVLQHEYTHTITLGQTQNRIPHWLTEAAAVSMELAPRDYGKCQMLARSWQEKSLFNLDEIKWAFVRPKRPGDRGKAYAQGHWMVEFMNERFGRSALVRLLQRYFDGEREQDAIPNALGVSREEFYEAFLEWAGEQVEQWGFAAEPSMMELTDALRESDPELSAVMEASRQARLDAIVRRLAEEVGQPTDRRREGLTSADWPELQRPPVTISDEQLDEWLAERPDHPDLLELKARRLEGDPATPRDQLIDSMHKYAAARPVDPYPHKVLARIYLESEDDVQAIPHLEELDIREEKAPTYAVELARLYRETGETENALTKATRAIHINPYHAPNRELAAAIAIQANRLDLAHRHIKALMLLEPDRPQHQKRLEAIERLIAERG